MKPSRDGSIPVGDEQEAEAARRRAVASDHPITRLAALLNQRALKSATLKLAAREACAWAVSYQIRHANLVAAARTAAEEWKGEYGGHVSKATGELLALVELEDAEARNRTTAGA